MLSLVRTRAFRNTNSTLSDKTPEPQRSYSVEHILSLELFCMGNPIAVSADGRWLAMTVHSHRRRRVGGDEFLPSGFPSLLEGGEIWIVDVESGKRQNITPSWGTSWGPSWAPDGKQLSFFTDKDGIAQLWIWECRTAEPRIACDVEIDPCLLEDVSSRWTPDGSRIVVKLRSKTPSRTRSEETTISPDEATVRLFRSIPKSPDEVETVNHARTDRFLADIGVVTVATGVFHRLRRKFPPLGLCVSPDGTTVAVADLRGFETEKRRQELYDLYLLPLDGGPPRCLAERIQFRGGLGPLLSWSPDGDYLAYATHGPLAKGELFTISILDGQRRHLNEGSNLNLGNFQRPPLWSLDGQYLFCIAGGHLWEVCVADGAIRKLTEGLGRDIVRIVHRPESSTVWSPDPGESIYIQTFHSQNKQSGFFRIDLTTGETHPLVEENRFYHSRLNLDVATDTGQIFYIAEDIIHPADVWVVDASFQNRHQLTKLNPQIDAIRFGEARLVNWKTPKGRELNGALLLPADYVPGQCYPLITYVYSGSFLSNRLNFFGLSHLGTPVTNMHILATQGYAVFLPDTPLETSDLIQKLTDAVLSGVDAVIDLGIADANRLGVMGHSFGGYCVNALVTQTPRFRAAVSSASISNLVSSYGFLSEAGDSPNIGNTELGQLRMGGSLWENRDAYIKNSPIFYLDRVETPLLLIHGELETRFTAQLGELFSGLRRLGKEAVLVTYLGEDHDLGSWRYPNAIDRWKRILAWFDEHLKF